MHCGAEVTESSTNKQHHLSSGFFFYFFYLFQSPFVELNLKVFFIIYLLFYSFSKINIFSDPGPFVNLNLKVFLNQFDFNYF